MRAIARRAIVPAIVLFVLGMPTASFAGGANGVDLEPSSGSPTASTGANGFDLTMANRRLAVASQGSDCPWRLAPEFEVPTTGASITEPVKFVGGRRVRWFADCRGNGPFEVLEPTGGEMAEDLWALLSSRVPLPEVAFGPLPRGSALVKVDTWVWLANGDPVVVSGELLGVRATITARPQTMRTSWGDGVVSSCEAPGTAFDTVAHPTSALVADPEPNGCSHVYVRHSGGEPDKRYAVSTDVEWSAAWVSSTGESGVFDPLTRTSVSPLRVQQIQAVSTPNG